ncbi:hypothetical protein HDV02_001921 [Globomyces sp. JEL0801]|nr:hypothetical protein HDV02_001921 [Globomyces sp. JEL0801]
MGEHSVASHEPPVIGINTRRRCRDVCFLFLFVIYWIGMFGIGLVSFVNGDIRQLILPKDYLGNFCGYDNSKENPNVYANQTGSPNLYLLDIFNSTTNPNATAICVPNCPTENILLVNSTSIDLANLRCQYGVVPDLSNYESLIESKVCTPYLYASTPILSRCVPTKPIPDSMVKEISVGVGNNTISLDSILSTGQSTITDFASTWKLFAAAAVTAIFLSFVWLRVSSFIVGPFIYLSILIVNLFALGTTGLLYLFWQSRITAIKNNGIATPITIPGINQTIDPSMISISTKVVQQDVTNSMIVFIVSCVVTGIIVLLTIAMLKRIKIAIQIISEAAKALRALPGVMSLYLLTLKNPTEINFLGFYIWKYENAFWVLMYAHIFGLLWAYFTIKGISQMTVAGAVAEWYWRLDKKAPMDKPVRKSLHRVFRYHLGSIMLGGMLIAIVDIIRILLYQVQQHLARTENQYLKYLVACAQCSMKLVEVLVKFINKNAYIYIAITGKAFFKSAGAATALLARNAAKTVAIEYVVDVAIFMAKLVVVGVNTFGAYAYLYMNKTFFPMAVTAPATTIALIAVETFIIVSVFFLNYELTIDTIFLSVLEDLDKNDGTTLRPYFMSNKLKGIMHKQNDSNVAAVSPSSPTGKV